MDLEQVISDLGYKPGWSFEYDDDRLIIIAEVPDSRDPARTVRFRMKRLIPEYISCAEIPLFLRWVTHVITEAEIHEMREFLRYKGNLLDDPHRSEVIS